MRNSEQGIRLFWRTLHYKAGVNGIVGMILIAILIVIAITAPLLAPYDPYEMEIGAELQAPSLKHLAGTDEFGRDVLSRTIYGARFSIGIAVGGVLSAMIVGAVLGLLAGVAGGVVEILIMRITDVLLAFPPILLGIFIMTIVTPGPITIAMAIFLANIARFIRFMRANVYQEISLEYVEAAKALGGGTGRLMFKHILPNCFSSLLIQANIAMINAILMEAGLSFIGLGAQAPQSSWGLMLKNARGYLRNAPYYALAPGIALSTLMIGLNFTTDALRSLLDPKSGS